MDKTVIASTLSKAHPDWDTALDWFLRVRAMPSDAALQADLERWLGEDTARRKTYRKVRRVWALTGIAVPGRIDLDRTPHATRAANARAHGRRRIWKVVATTAITTCLLLCLSPLQLWLSSDYRTGIGEVRRIVLADGSVVQLNADSALALRFDQAGRGVRLLKGEAFFEVASDASRPFRVAAKDVGITVVGTAFNVKLTDATVDVAVAHGIVAVHEPASTSEHRLGAGDELLAHEGEPADPKTIAPNRIARWREGRLIVDGATVGEVVDALGAYHHGIIRIPSELRQRRVTGIYDLRDPVATLRSIAQPFGAEVHAYTPYLLSMSAKAD